MPRPRKCRRVCCLPEIDEFYPARREREETETVILTVDEYETIRLIDNEGFSQEECGEYMKIARTTVQQIYNIARKKLARALVDGLILKIQGGNYQLCEGGEPCPGCCYRHRQLQKINKRIMVNDMKEE